MSSGNVKAYFAVLGFAVLLFGAIALGIASNWGVFRQPTREQVLNADAVNTAALADGEIDIVSADLFLQVVPPSSGEELRELTVTLTEAVLYARDDNVDLDYTDVCFTEILVYINDQTEYNLLKEPLCQAVREDTFFADELIVSEKVSFDNYYVLTFSNIATSTEPIKLNKPDDVTLNFWYPFDSFATQLQIAVFYEARFDDGDFIAYTIQPLVAWDIQTSGKRVWDINISNKTTEFELENLDGGDPLIGTFEDVSITFERPLLYRVAFPFFMLMMVLLIALVPLLSDRDILVDISAAMLFGIFGIKGILGPGDEMGQTILDIGLIALYVVLAFSALLFFIRRVLDKGTPATAQDT